jgi:hypothetical protein
MEHTQPTQQPPNISSHDQLSLLETSVWTFRRASRPLPCPSHGGLQHHQPMLRVASPTMEATDNDARWGLTPLLKKPPYSCTKRPNLPRAVAHRLLSLH